jgi:hypothetical protein
MRREEIWKRCEELAISTDLLKKVKSVYEKTITCVKTDRGQSSWFETRSGVRQGSVL